ncbi:hypothetical protein SK128_010736 [Halocaridina rubra]|uniref:Uncharacterized protein n=1 Tax=Halocaridina rubra TaxID=373956 RepID=A0AAN9AA02_HALRR
MDERFPLITFHVDERFSLITFHKDERFPLITFHMDERFSLIAFHMDERFPFEKNITMTKVMAYATTWCTTNGCLLRLGNARVQENRFTMQGGDKNYGKIRCPVHKSPSRDLSMSTLWRRKSFDSAYLYRTDIAAQHGGDGRKVPRNPFIHSHSVNCAAEGTNLSCDTKAKSVTSVAAQTPRPRPNVLELYPNLNNSNNAIRRRLSRSSERSYDFEDFCYDVQSYVTASPTATSKTRIFPKTSTKASRASPNLFLCRRDVHASGQGRLGNIRKGLSLLSLCAGEVDPDEEFEDHHAKKILRPPTRHFYQRGISGIPVKRPAKYMGLAF